MSEKTFNTKKEMLEAGYVPAKPRQIKVIGKRAIAVVDTSGSPWFGYDFSIKIVPSKAALHPFAEGRLPQCPDTEFAHSVNVWLNNELNKVNQPGCVVVAFKQEEIDKAVAAAEAWCRDNAE